MWFVRTTKSETAAAVRIGARLAARERGDLLGLLRDCFARPEPWLQAGKYLSALAGGLARRNGWTIAEHAGDRAPDTTQRLLNRGRGCLRRGGRAAPVRRGRPAAGVAVASSEKQR
jgi:hypothetical protein